MFSRKMLHDNPLLANTLGIACIIAAPLIGWLPGPGGIPLLLAGLGLLSIHNAWAQRLKSYVSHHSANLRELLFPSNSKIEMVWDFLAASLVGLGIYVVLLSKSGIMFSLLGTTLPMTGITLFLLNKNRLGKLKDTFKK